MWVAQKVFISYCISSVTSEPLLQFDSSNPTESTRTNLPKRYVQQQSLSSVTNLSQDDSFKYIRIRIKTQQGVQNFTAEEATRIAGEDPDYMIRDMFEAIERGDYPKWNVYVQVMDPAEAEKYRWNIFDMTKVWPHEDFPLRQIGQLTLNRNVSFDESFSAELRTTFGC